MLLTVLLAISALAISSVAAYFSVIGLAVIFAASAIPIIIMGATVEVGKISAVAWVHYNWHRITGQLKIIMVSCIIVAMVLTSVGVFGFLSKAHVEQTLLGDEAVAQVQRIETEIVRQNSVIERGENKIIVLEFSNSNTDNTIEIQITNEETRITSASERIQPALDEQKQIISDQTTLYQVQLNKVNERIDLFTRYIEEGEIKKAQSLIGTKPDGSWKSKTTAAAKLWTAKQEAEQQRLIAKIEDVSQNNTAILAARQEIKRIRIAYETQLAESNKLINRLRAKLGNTNATNIDELIDEQYLRISNANKSIESLTSEKYEIEAEFRQLEAEVGPIKYIAEFVYGEKADATLLERAVKWMIILLLLVLDPFAVTLVIAATDGYRFNRDDKKRSGLDGKLMYVDDNGKDHIIKLEENLESEATRYDALMRTLEMRNKEMNELRVALNEAVRQQDVEAVNKLAAKLEDVESVRDELVQEFQDYRNKAETQLENASISSDDLIVERDSLQRELNQLADGVDIVEKEIEKVPLLEAEIRKLTKGLARVTKNEEILTRQSHTINITAPGNEASLRHKVHLLSDRINSMIDLSEFDIESAQELVEVKQQKLDVERRFEELNKKYDDLMK